MKKKNKLNEYRGIGSIIIISILAIILVYCYLHSNKTQQSDIPVEAPVPPTENTGRI